MLSSSQVSQRPTTPTPIQQLQQQPQSFFSTPQGPRDLYIAQRDLQSVENLGRKTRVLLQKAGKALASANARAAGLEAGKRRLEQQLEAASSQRRRKRVQVDPNQRFAEVETIREAIHAAEALAAQQGRSTILSTPEGVAAATAAATLQSMCTTWQL